MIRIFHSMPLRGRTPSEIAGAREWQHKAARRIVASRFNVPEDECVIIDSFIKDYPEGANPLWFLGHGIQEHLSQANVLVLAPDWAGARGCRCERDIAGEYQIPVLELAFEDGPGE